jgi:micrococcal nuclease
VTRTPFVKTFAAITVLLCLPLLARAATLQAQVIEVESGNTLVVNSINRALRIRLKGVAPPEVNQPFSETAREHLKTLVIDKVVALEYTHLEDGYLHARIVLNGIDIGSQMLRDGVAWYDRAGDFGLKEVDRNLYAQCEQAARNEKRGLWQDQSPVAPWEYRRAQLARLNGIVSTPSFRQSQTRRANKSSLSNDDLMGSMIGPGSIAGLPNFKPITANGTPGRWTRFESVTEHFSVLFPSDGLEATYTALDGAGKIVPFHYLAGHSDQTGYMLLSTRGSNAGHTDASAADEAVHEFIGGFNNGIKTAGSKDAVTAKPIRDIRLSSYAGKQYTLNSRNLSGVIRVFSRQVGDERELIMLIVLNSPGSESSANQFLNSFKISGN